MRAFLWIGLIAAATVVLAPAAAPAQDDDARGGRLLDAVERGDRRCADLDAPDFAAIGEHLMARMAGGTAAHEAMDEAMRAMMGDGAEQAAHEQMGRRLAGCRSGALGGMMAMMLGGPGAMPGGPSGAMMGRAGPGGMMDGDDGGRYRGRWPGYGVRRELADVDGDWHGDDTAIVVMMALLLVLGGAVLWLLRPGRSGARSEAPRAILARRFAAGEIDQEEYDRRREALGGT